MKELLVKIILFMILLVVLFYVNLFTFRSDVPFLYFITFVGSVILLMLIPYKKVFNINQN